MNKEIDQKKATYIY